MTTDGIIQKVLIKYIQLHDSYCPDKETNLWNKKIYNELLLVQQELIESIKNYELLFLKDNGKDTTYVPKISLIGDAL